jgi:hypothetical protein
MSIQSEHEYEVTCAKLQQLEKRYREICEHPDHSHIERLTLQSLRRMINQRKEEMAMFKARAQHAQI